MKTIIEMAREAGFVMHMSELFAKEMPEHQDEFTAKLTAFAELVRADERERIKQENQRCYVDRKSAQGGNT